MEKSRIPTRSDIELAYKRIKRQVHNTPILSSSSINKITGATLFFKCENFQKAGAFKFRGATNALLNLTEKNKLKAVATHSSGNHAGALAKASQKLGIRCIVVMPENSPEIKVNAVREYGAEIVFCEASLQAREKILKQVVEETKAVFIHPYNNFDIIAGQGTAALELISEQTGLEILLVPVGGGGLLSGTSIVAKGMHPKIQVFGAEPFGADDAWQSFHQKKIIPSINPQTIADGLLTSLGELTYSAIIEHVDDILRVSEASIILAMKLLSERMKILVEPSGCVPLAAVLEYPKIFSKKRTGIILSGGNIDMKHFNKIVH